MNTRAAAFGVAGRPVGPGNVNLLGRPASRLNVPCRPPGALTDRRIGLDGFGGLAGTLPTGCMAGVDTDGRVRRAVASPAQSRPESSLGIRTGVEQIYQE